MASTPTASGKPADWIHAYTRDFSGDEFKRLFTHDTRDAYDFFTRGQSGEAYAKLPWWKQLPLRFRQFMAAFTLRLSPARRALYYCALFVAAIGVLNLYRGFDFVPVPFGTPFFQVGLLLPIWAPGNLHADARVPAGQPSCHPRGGRSFVAEGRARGRARDPARDAAARHVRRGRHRDLRHDAACQHGWR